MGSLQQTPSCSPNPNAHENAAKSWKQIVDEKLHRLHSLQFGADLALEKGEAETALALGLCLLGFLESECQSAEDRTYISPIIDQTRDRIDAARERAAPSIDRHSFEQANCKESRIFTKCGVVDVGKIRRSKYFLPFMGPKARLEQRLVQDAAAAVDSSTSFLGTGNVASGSTVQQSLSLGNNLTKDRNVKTECLEESVPKACKSLTQAKLTTLYGNGSVKVPEKSGRQSVDIAQNHILPNENTKPHSSQRPFVRNQASSPVNVDNEDERSHSWVAKRKRPSHLDESSSVLKKAELNNDDNETGEDTKITSFVTAKQKWAMDGVQKRSTPSVPAQPTSPVFTGPSPASYHSVSSAHRFNGPKTLGMSRRGVRGNFIPPVRSSGTGAGCAAASLNPVGLENGLDESTRKCLELLAGPDGELPDKLKNVEPKLIEHISNEIMDQDPNVRWDDIAGLEHAKKCVTEMVIWPLLRPDIFQGCRAPGKGLLLFGPPGTGKTMIGKAIAGEAKATFFSISASSLTSKWIGEGEKLVRALFGVASCRQPAVIFIDEIDSLLSQRKSDGEHESSRRLKTQFLIEMEGCGSGNDRLLLIGATNRPQELDEAARRRLSKRLYIPLPSADARAWIITNLLKKDGLFSLSDEDICVICASTEGYSGSDMSNLVKEASMGPLREMLMQGIDISKLKKEEMRSVMLQDFQDALLHVKPSVSQNELGAYEDWNRQFGSHSL